MTRIDVSPHSLGQWALVLGGSSGIGRAIASELAQRGFDLVLVGRNRERLTEAQQHLSSRNGVTVETLAIDLGQDGAGDRVVAAISEREVGLFVTTAGEGKPGLFTDTGLASYLECINVKVRSTLTIAHHLAGAMRQRQRGAMLLASSTGALQGVSRLANNAAAESYVLGFGESLHHELKPYGIGVTVFLPGPTLTPGLLAMLPEGTQPPRGTMSPEITAAQGLKALASGKASVIAGAGNRAVMTLLPRGARTRLLSTMVARWMPPSTDSRERAKAAA